MGMSDGVVWGRSSSPQNELGMGWLVKRAGVSPIRCIISHRNQCTNPAQINLIKCMSSICLQHTLSGINLETLKNFIVVMS